MPNLQRQGDCRDGWALTSPQPAAELKTPWCSRYARSYISHGSLSLLIDLHRIWGQRHSEITGLGLGKVPNSVVPPYSAPHSSLEDHHVLLSSALPLLEFECTSISTHASTHPRLAARLRSMAPATEAVVARPATRKPPNPSPRSLSPRDQARLRFCSWSTNFKLTTNRCLERATL